MLLARRHARRPARCGRTCTAPWSRGDALRGRSDPGCQSSTPTGRTPSCTPTGSVRARCRRRRLRALRSGALPAFDASGAATAAVIGLGSGDTVHAVAGRREIQRVTCVEIIRGEFTTLTGCVMRLPYGGLANLLDDPRIEQVLRGRPTFTAAAAAADDIIEADALRPGSAYSGTRTGRVLRAVAATTSRAERPRGDVGADAARLPTPSSARSSRGLDAGDSRRQQPADRDRPRRPSARASREPAARAAFREGGHRHRAPARRLSRQPDRLRAGFSARPAHGHRHRSVSEGRASHLSPR